MRFITLAIVFYALFSTEPAFAGPQSPCYLQASSVACFKPVALSGGGTAKALTAVNGGLVYSDADSFEVTAAGTASQWVLSGGAGTPTMSNTTTTGKTIDGSADEVQLTVQGNGTQTSNILLVETSAGTDLMTLANSGDFALGVTTGNAAIDSTAGSATTPTYSFVGDTNTGFYRILADGIGLSLGGTEEVRFEANGMFVKAASTYQIALNDSDGSDDGTLRLAGGGSAGETRGASIYLYGNESADNGDLILAAGTDAASGQIGLTTNGTRQITIDDDGSVAITDTGSNGGNVPHRCERRSGSTTSSGAASQACSAGEIAMGGGCQLTSGAGTLESSYPSADTTWTCDYSANVSFTIWVVCCDY